MKNLAAALNKMQGAMTPAIKDATNSGFKSRYADLAAVWDAIRKPLADNGLSVTQQTDVTETGQMILITTVWHVSGENLSARYPLNPAQNTSQAWGSCLSYARRYCLSALLGVTQDDDDGNAASQSPSNAGAKPPAPKPNKAPAAVVGDKQAGGVDAAQAWAKNAARALQEMRTAEAVDAWLNAAAEKLARLQQVSPALYDSIMTIATATHDNLRHQDAAE